MRPAVQNYEYNIGEISSKDITKISSDELPDGDVVIGGFPCQPFSNAGNRLGTNDDRGNLYLEMIRIINDKKPKVVLMENVRGLLSMKNKDGSLLIDTIVYLLSNAGDGYNVSYKLLKASDYGVPQNRYRVVIVGVRKDYGFTFKFPKPLNIDPEKLTVGYALRGITKDMPNAEDIWNLSPQSLDIISKIPEGGSWKSISYEDLPERLQKIRDNMKKYHSPNFYRRFSRIVTYEAPTCSVTLTNVVSRIE